MYMFAHSPWARVWVRSIYHCQNIVTHGVFNLLLLPIRYDTLCPLPLSCWY